MKCNKILNDIIEMIKDNKKILQKLYEEDKEVFAVEFDINTLIEKLNQYKNPKVKENGSRKILLSHYGNPYITAMLCMEAIINQTEIVIGIEDICYGINKAIVKIVNDILKEYELPVKMYLKNNVTNKDIEEMNINEIICLGNSNSYTNFRNIKDIQVKHVPFFDIALYYDSDEFEELAENIRKYAVSNLYEIEIYDETEDFEDVIYMINHGTQKYCATILSKDKEKQNKFKQEINSQIICINENPFKKFEFKIPEGIF